MLNSYDCSQLQNDTQVLRHIYTYQCSSFVDGITFDGMRKCLAQDFNKIFVLDLGGNVRENPKLSGTTHNVFGIQVGVSINIFIKRNADQNPEQTEVFYFQTGEFWRKNQKYEFLEEKKHIFNIDWETIHPDSKHTWLTKGMIKEFESFIPLGTKESKKLKRLNVETIFKIYSLGVATNRDEWVYDFQKGILEDKVNHLIDNYNLEVFRYASNTSPVNIDDFVNYDPKYIKWTDRLKNELKKKKTLSFNSSELRNSMYRPFCVQYLYFDSLLNQRRYRQHTIFPTPSSEDENLIIIAPSLGSKQISFFVSNLIPDLNFFAGSTPIQCFPLYIYSEKGDTCRENITDWSLSQFQTHYNDNTITKQDIFYYVYGVLQHREYREKYSANLKRELPHIPFTPDFWAFAKAGKALSGIHVNYEKQPEYKLKWIEEPDAKVHYRVDKMTLSKDKTQIIYNNFLTLAGIPPVVFEYRLGNRSALEWIIDQYRVKTDKRSGITNDPNNLDDPQYIIRLVGKVITVSLETIK